MIDPVLWAHVLEEHQRQQEKHGPQNYKPGTGDEKLWVIAENVKALVGAKDDLGTTTWAEVLTEEVCEVLAERDPANLKAELIQVATVCLAWATKINCQPQRRYPDPPSAKGKAKAERRTALGFPMGKPI